MTIVFVTGMSGTGKSTALAELARRGCAVVDTDDDGWGEWVDGVDGSERIWRADRIDELLSAAPKEPLFLSGCVGNQGRFYDRFDAVVLLSAPVDVLLDRIARRTTNDFGKKPDELGRILQDFVAIEPRLQATCTHEIPTTRSPRDVVDELVAIGRGRGRLSEGSDARACYGENPWPGTCSSRGASSLRSARESPQRRWDGYSRPVASPCRRRSSTRI